MTSWAKRPRKESALFVSRRVYNDLKDQRDREVAALKLTIEMLAEQVDYLRAVGGHPHAPSAPRMAMSPLQPAPVPGEDEAFRMMPAQFESEEEADLRALQDAGLLDAEDLKAALAQLGYTDQ